MNEVVDQKNGQEEVGENDENELKVAQFRVTGFPIRSRPWIVLLAFSILFGFFGFYLLIQLTALIFVIAPSLYRRLRLYKISIWALHFPSILFRILSWIPTVNLRGDWFIEEKSKTVNLGSVKELRIFIFSHKSDCFIIYPGIVALCLRITFNIERHFFNLPLDTEYFLGISFGGNWLAFLMVPPLFIIYFVLVWVWKDAGIKIASINQKSQKENIVTDGFGETPEIWFAASGFKNLIGLVAGISTITWVSEKALEENPTMSPEIAGFAALVGVLIAFIVIFSGAGILMAGMYYRSGLHEEFVNNVRTYISKKYRQEKEKGNEFKIKIGSYRFQSFEKEELAMNDI